MGYVDQKGGIRLLKAVKKLDTEGKTVCVIFTNFGGDSPQEAADFWDRLVSESQVDSSDAVVISKRSMEDLGQFEAELRRALLNALSPELLRWAATVADQALKQTIAKLRIEGDVLNAVVLQSSEQEGIHPTETLFRLIDGEFRGAREQVAISGPALSDFRAIKCKLEQLATLTPTDESSPPLTARVRQLRRRELYRTQVDIGGWPSPIWLGDLWKVTLVNEPTELVEQFVLVAQPCDIILRSRDGTRSQEWVLLIPIKKEKGKHAETVVELKYFDDAKLESSWVNLKKARVANSNVLDLVAIAGPTFDEAKIAELKTLSHVHTSVAKRAAHLAVWLTQALAPPTSRSSLALFSSPGPVAKLSVGERGVDFHCERVGRIEPELALLILQRYGNFVARHALPHDFADFEK